MTILSRTGNSLVSESAQADERIIATLDALGVSYLSRRGPLQDAVCCGDQHPESLLAAMACPSSARVRAAIVSLLLARPEYQIGALPACVALAPMDRATLMLFYTAAVLLQRLHESELRAHHGGAWHPLPDLFSGTLAVSLYEPPERALQDLARRHTRLTGSDLNWEGTYRDAAARLLRQWRLDARWSS